MRICVVGGGGAAGLCAIKHCLQKNLDVIGFEQTSSIGGTWVYTEKIGFDEHNLPIHSSMYRSLHTNLPKELMCFPDFPFPPHESSYLPASEVLTYLRSYADAFRVREKIKFNHHVVNVRPLLPPPSNGSGGDLWEVLVRNLITKEYETLQFDGVLVCNGHFSVPHIPSEFVGREVFKGRQMHSHEYRTPEIFTNERVLVIGGEFITFIRNKNSILKSLAQMGI
jgi:dimethylaniline monooxygenase (N-oxide forming)